MTGFVGEILRASYWWESANLKISAGPLCLLLGAGCHRKDDVTQR